MQIDHVETFKVPPRWLFVRVATTDGVVGWGEATLEGLTNTVEAAVHGLSDDLIGKDPLAVLDLWSVMYRRNFYRGGPVLMSAISGIDQALWDIRGIYFQVPAYRLIGGPVRDKVRVYAWIGGDDPGQAVDEAQARLAQGFRGLKMNATGPLERITCPADIDAVVTRVGAIREAVGDQVDIALDFHGRVSRSMATVLLSALTPLRPFFVEEPVLPEYNEALEHLAHRTSIPLATGERMYGRWGFKSVLEAGSVDVLQPDLSHAGGLSEVYRIAAMAEAYDVSIAPHCPLGPVALAACLQLDGCISNFLIQEMSLGIHYNQGADLVDYVHDPSVFTIDQGYVRLPQGPGLGIQVNEAAVREAAVPRSSWRNPVWRLPDGSYAEW